MIEWLHPGFILIAGALLIPLFKGKWKKAYLPIPPALALTAVVLMIQGVLGNGGTFWNVPFLQYTLILGRVDKLSLCFALIFTLAAFCMVIYALNVKSSIEHMAAFFYAGSAIGVVFAGDLITVYIFWEIMAVASVLLVLLRKTDRSARAGFRYILWHFAGGLSLLAGIIIYVVNTGTIEFDYIGLGGGLASCFIFIGFLLNAGVPPMHGWLPDSYPEATITGAVFMSAFTTKTSVYILARTFPGTDILIYLGAIMVVYPIFYAVLENNIRKVLGYSLLNQVGFMLVGIGIGTPLAICGTVAHAFCHIIYKGLLFMSAGSVMQMTGKENCTELGGLYKTMPFTTVCCMIGAASISAFPGFSGFISKSMIIAEAAHFQLGIVWVLLLLASAGVFHHAGVKVPYFAFFAKDAGIKAKDPPLNMKLAMGIGAFLCIFIGIFPQYLYNILPYDPVALGFIPYTGAHVVSQAQLLMFASLAFYVLIISGVYPPEQKKLNLDTDWLVRIPGMKFVWFCKGPVITFGNFLDRNVLRVAGAVAWFSRNPPAAMSIMKDAVSAKVIGGEYEMRVEEEIKRYPGELPRLAISASILLILLFFLIYLLLYVIGMY